MPATALDALPTPSLLLDRDRLRSNLARMATRVAALGGVLRPHVKTHKCPAVLDETRAAGAMRGITVSTLAEAEQFFAAGERDILYAVGIVPAKLERAAALIQQGCSLRLILDSVAAAEAVRSAGEAMGVTFPVLIEIDVDGARAGVVSEGEALLAIAEALGRGFGARLDGVMSHSGGTYGCTGWEEIAALAERERALTVLAAARLRAAGHAAPIVSIGSTPAALTLDRLDGVTEVRAGVYGFFDMVQAGLGVCRPEDVAISVLASVIGHQPDKGWVLTDAGWMALSRDRGHAPGALDLGYGPVCDAHGAPLAGLIIAEANQEHGIARTIDGSPPPGLRVGERVRILPNHACATAAQHRHYWVVEGGAVVDRWDRFGGW